VITILFTAWKLIVFDVVPKDWLHIRHFFRFNDIPKCPGGATTFSGETAHSELKFNDRGQFR
jgi:hypothetical protein